MKSINISEYCYKTELHAHTYPVSACSQISPEDTVAAYIEAGVNTLTVTNHLTEHHLVGYGSFAEAAEAYLSDYYAARKAAEGTSLNVCLGAEIRFAGTNNDYLLFGICPEDMENVFSYIPRTVEEFYTDFKNDKNLLIHAHPRRANMEPTPYGYVDGLEVYNLHPGIDAKMVYTAFEARSRELLVTGGSDFHGCGGGAVKKSAICVMRTKQELKNSYDVAAAIKSRDVIFDMFGHIILPYFQVQ